MKYNVYKWEFRDELIKVEPAELTRAEVQLSTCVITCDWFSGNTNLSKSVELQNEHLFSNGWIIITPPFLKIVYRYIISTVRRFFLWQRMLIYVY